MTGEEPRWWWKFLLAGLVLLAGCARKAPANDPELTRFLQLRESQARALAGNAESQIPAGSWALFKYLQRDEWSKATNAFVDLQRRSGRSGTPLPPSPIQPVLDLISDAGQKIGLPPPTPPSLEGQVCWHAIVDAHWAYVLYKTWRAEPLKFIVANIERTVPPGAIFFGDSDPGRFALGRAMESRKPNERFWVLTQNQLADYSYWDYVRFLCRSNITMPSSVDFGSAYSRYAAGNYGTGVDAVAALNAEFSRKIAEQNPSHRIYMEASWWFPQWAYDRAVPRGLGFEIKQTPITQLEKEVLEADREFWSGVCQQFLGDKIGRERSLEELCEWVERIYLRRDLSGFTGDKEYVSDTVAQGWFGMARHSTAALYGWRCIQAQQVEEKQRMFEESIFAYKQVLALSPTTTMDFAGMLSQIGRTNEAARLSAVRERIAGRVR